MSLVPLLYTLSFLVHTSASSCGDGATSTIIVSDNGTDNSTCLEGTLACRSLQFALSSPRSCTRIKVLTDQRLTQGVFLADVQDLMIEGEDLTKVCCSMGAGLVATGCHNLTLSRLQFEGCGWRPPGEDLSAAVLLRDCSDVTFTGCSFSRSSACGLALLNLTGGVLVSDSTFSHLSLPNNASNEQLMVVGMYLNLTAVASSRSSYAVINCSFSNISNTRISVPHTSPREVDDAGIGGGLVVFVGEDSSNNTITISKCTFSANRARIGGGAYVVISAHSTGNSLLISQSDFSMNLATSLSGGLHIGVTDPEGTRQLPQHILTSVAILNSQFTRNTAAHAGGLAIQILGQLLDEVDKHVILSHCLFESNVADNSGAAIALFKWEGGLGGSPVTVQLLNCTVANNSMYISVARQSVVVGSGVIYTQGIPITLSGQTVIRNNVGTAILASSASLFFNNSVFFTGNSGIRGGAISLVSGSRVVVRRGLNLTFQENIAHLYGGAIYHTFPVLGVVGQNQYCVFQYEYKAVIDAALWEADIWFINNSASVSGQSLFISSPDSCQLDSSGRPFTETSTYHFVPDTPDQVTTPTVRLNFSGHVQLRDDGSFWTEVMLGEEMQLDITAVDQWDDPVKGFTIVYLGCLKGEEPMVHTSGCGYSLEGTNLVELNGEPVRVNFFIKGERASNLSDRLVFIWEMLQEPTSVTFLHVSVTSCRLGYVYNNEKQYCTCYQSENVACIEENYTSCVQEGYWYGEVLEGEYAVYSCPFGYCNYTVGKGCPTEQCGQDGSAYQFFCKLPKENSDVLCLEDRGGVLCSSCAQNHSFTFNGLECAPDDQCTPAYIALLLFFILLFWVVTVSVLLAVVKLDLHVGSGRIYCFIFFFSVLQFFVGGSFPSLGLYAIELIFTGFIQLDPKVFGLIKVCVPVNLNNLQYAILHYINPLFLTLVIIIIVLVSRKCTRLTLFRHSSHGINTVCVLLYFSFFSLTFTSLTILTPVRFSNINMTFVAVQPNTTYFHPSQHLPYALVAMTVELLFVIPFLLLLLLYPFLLRFKKLNLTRLKPIFDEYYACYQDRYRSFAGFYLASLQVVFLLPLFNLGTFGNIYFLQIFSILMLTVHAVVQPYHEQWLNILDTFFILDLVLLSILHGNTANIVFDDAPWIKTTLIYLLILFPVLYFILLCLSPALKWMVSWVRKRTVWRKMHTRQNNRVDTFNKQEALPSQTSRPQLLEREPLLFNNSQSLSYTLEKEEVGEGRSGNGQQLPNYTVVELTRSSEWARHTTPPSTSKTSVLLQPTLEEDN